MIKIVSTIVTIIYWNKVIWVWRNRCSLYHYVTVKVFKKSKSILQMCFPQWFYFGRKSNITLVRRKPRFFIQSKAMWRTVPSRIGKPGVSRSYGRRIKSTIHDTTSSLLGTYFPTPTTLAIVVHFFNILKIVTRFYKESPQ